MKITVRCPKCGATKQLEMSDTVWLRVQKNVVVARVLPGALCEHGFRVYVTREGQIQGYDELEDLESKVEPVQFNVGSALQTLGEEALATLLTAVIAEKPLILIGSPPITAGIKQLLRRLLPESVKPEAIIFSVTREQYEQLPESTRKMMTVDIKNSKVLNRIFDDEQLWWIRRALVRARMLLNQNIAEEIVLKEASKLRQTVSVLRHLAARSMTTGKEEPGGEEPGGEEQE